MLNVLNQHRFAYNLKSLLFDGVDEFVNIGEVSAFNFDRLDTFSISAWIYTNSTGAMVIFTNYINTYAGSSRSYMFRVNPLSLYFHIQRSSADRIIVEAPAISQNTWHHVVATYDGSSLASGCNIYIDGVSQSLSVVQDNLTGSIQDFTNNTSIGARGDSNQAFNGYIDEVSVWNKELTGAEVTELYNSGCPSDVSTHSAVANCVSWWKMGEDDTIASITDQISVNDGTPTNMEAEDITSFTKC